MSNVNASDERRWVVVSHRVAPCAILFKPGLRIFVVCFVVIPVTLLVCLWADTQQTANHYILDLSLYQFSYIIGLVLVENFNACRLLIYVFLSIKSECSVIRIGLRRRSSLRGLKGAFPVRVLRHFYLCCVILAHTERVFMMATTASDRYILGVCAEVLHLCWSALNMAWVVDTWVVTVQSSACPWVWLMRDRASRGKSRIVVRFGVLREG